MNDVRMCINTVILADKLLAVTRKMVATTSVTLLIILWGLSHYNNYEGGSAARILIVCGLKKINGFTLSIPLVAQNLDLGVNEANMCALIREINPSKGGVECVDLSQD